MVKSVETITELIGNTPLVKLNRLVSDDSADVYVKVESFNAGGSVKDRIALNSRERWLAKTWRHYHRSNKWKYRGRTFTSRRCQRIQGHHHYA